MEFVKFHVILTKENPLFAWQIAIVMLILPEFVMRQFQKSSKALENSRCDLKVGRFRVLPLWVAPLNYQLSSHQRSLFNLLLTDFWNHLSFFEYTPATVEKQAFLSMKMKRNEKFSFFLKNLYIFSYITPCSFPFSGLYSSSEVIFKSNSNRDRESCLWR